MHPGNVPSGYRIDLSIITKQERPILASRGGSTPHLEHLVQTALRKRDGVQVALLKVGQVQNWAVSWSTKCSSGSGAVCSDM